MKAEHEAVRTRLFACNSAARAEIKIKVTELATYLRGILYLEENYLYPEIPGMFPGSEVVSDICIFH